MAGCSRVFSSVLVFMDGLGIRPALLELGERLAAALADAGVDHRIETYAAKHGWVFRDIPVYDEAAAERHWQAQLALFDGTLKDSA